MHPARHNVVPDRVVAATYVAAAGITGGDVTIADARPDHMEMLLRKLGQMGVVTSLGPDGLRATAARRLSAADVATLPYPGVATDYSPLLVTMLSGADGVGIVTENLFSGRFRYVEELRRMGADIRTQGHHAVVRGVPRLSGRPGAGARHPGRGGPGAGRPGGRGGDHRHRGPPHQPGLRGSCRHAGVTRARR